MPVLFDSSLYITALRLGDLAAVALRRWSEKEPVWLSSVVLYELYAGTSSIDRRLVERLERDFQQANRIVLPNLKDWVDSGKLISRLAAKYHLEHIGRSRLTNDTLIALSAARLGVTVFTANERDFARIAEFRPFQWQVRHTLTS